MFTRTLVLSVAIVSIASFVYAEVPAKVTFDDHVNPIFRQHCQACHDQGGRSGDLALDSYRDTITGGAGGEVVAASDVDGSRLWRLIAHLDKPIMPPGQDKIPAEQLEIVKAWIDGGLLENSGSKPMKPKKSAVAAFTPSADNRPAGEPAMPSGFYREPVIHVAQAGMVGEVAASPWAPLAAVAGQRQVMLYHTQSRELLGIVPFVVGAPEVIRFSRNGDLLLVAGGRGAALGVAHLWDVKTGRRIAELGDELDTVLAADISADQSLVAIGGPRKVVKVFRTGDGSLAYEITKHTDWVTALEFSPNGQFLATGDRAGNGHTWEAPTGRPLGNLSGHGGPIAAVSWRGDSAVVATASEDSTVRTWQTEGNQIKQWNAHGGGVLDVAYTKDGRIMTAGRDRTAKLWDAEGKELGRLAEAKDLVLSVVPTHDDALAITSDWTGEVRVADVKTFKQVGTLAANPPTLAMRLQQTEQKVAELEKTVAPAQQAKAAAEAIMAQVEKTIANHKAKQQQAAQTVAQLQKKIEQHTSDQTAKQAAMAQIDQAIAASKAQQQVAQAELANLNEQLAAIGNQVNPEVDSGESPRKIPKKEPPAMVNPKATASPSPMPRQPTNSKRPLPKPKASWRKSKRKSRLKLPSETVPLKR